jgi:replicative DNA helicase
MTDLEPITIPHSPAIEKSILGACLLDAELVRKLDVSPEDFYITRHTWIWAALTDLSREGLPDYVSVSRYLHERGHLAEIGGQAYLTQLISEVVNTNGLQAWGNKLIELSKRRKVIQVVNDTVKTAFDISSDLDTAIGKTIDNLVKLSRTTNGAVHIGQVTSRVYDDIEERCRNPRDIFGFSTGLSDLDKLTDGLTKKSLYILSGEPGKGKSLLGYQICGHMANDGHPGAVYELEMPAEQLIRRDVSAKAQIKTDSMLRGKISENEWADFTAAIDVISNLPIYLSDATDWTTLSIRADLSRLKSLYGIEWCMVDYLILLNDLPNEKEYERAAYCSRQLKAIAKDLDIVLIAINSMTKNGMGNEQPGMKDLRGGGQVSYDADDIWFLMDDPQDKTGNMRRLVPVKARERDHLEFIKLLKKPGFPAFGQAMR